MGTFLLMANLGFSLMSQLGRYILGTFYHTILFQFLSNNIFLQYEGFQFWSIFLGLNLVIWIGSAVILFVKKSIENAKERSLQMRVTNTLALPKKKQGRLFNNSAYNLSLFASKDVITYLMVISLVAIGTLFMSESEGDILDWYRDRCYQELFLFHIGYKILWPIYYLMSRNDVYRYMVQSIKEQFL